MYLCSQLSWRLKQVAACVMNRTLLCVQHKRYSTAVRRKPVPFEKWLNIQSQREFFDKLAEKLKIKTPQDWYKVKYEDIVANGLSSQEHSN